MLPFYLQMLTPRSGFVYQCLPLLMKICLRLYSCNCRKINVVLELGGRGARYLCHYTQKLSLYPKVFRDGSCQILVINTETRFKADGRRQTAEGFKTFCYLSVELVTKTGDSLRLSCNADVLQSLPCLNCGNLSFFLPFCRLPSAICLPSTSDHQKLPRADNLSVGDWNHIVSFPAKLPFQ